MIRITTLLWVALLIVAGGTVMRVSYQVRHVQEHLVQLSRDTQREQDSIRILTAEWDTLNDPQRIDALAQRYLTLGPTPIQRVVSLEDIPMKPSPEQAAQMAALAAKKSAKTHPALSAVATVAARTPVPAVSRAVTPVALPAATLASGGGAITNAQSLVLMRTERRE